MAAHERHGSALRRAAAVERCGAGGMSGKRNGGEGVVTGQWTKRVTTCSARNGAANL